MLLEQGDRVLLIEGLGAWLHRCSHMSCEHQVAAAARFAPYRYTKIRSPRLIQLKIEAAFGTGTRMQPCEAA
jgi:hypothetical protein